MFLITEVIISFGLNFVFCELGERIESAFNGISFDIEQLDWYLLPAKVVKSLPIILINVQEPVVIKCFGSIPCARETYKKVSHKSE